MPAIVRGKRNGTRALIKGRKSYTTLYTMRSARTKATVTFPVHVVVTYSKGRQGKNKAITYLYASSSSHPPLDRMQEEYRLRFGIESSYRLLTSSRIRTSTRDPKLRVLYVAASLLLMNAWVEKKWTNLSTARRGPGGRTVHEDGPPLCQVPDHAPVHPREEVRVHAGCRGSSEEECCWLKEGVVYELLSLAKGYRQIGPHSKNI